MKKKGLWTKDFTVITLGSMVSLFGTQLVIFAMSLYVLDLTGSTLLYSFVVFLYTLPQVVAPIFAGPLLDHFSRRRTIFILDFFSASLYLAAGALIFFRIFHFAALAAVALLIGTINSIYQVAFNSFYPMLIPAGNFSKAYSVSSTIETLAFSMVPVAMFMYKGFGMLPILIISAGSFLIAALFETGISDVEKTEAYRNVRSYSVREYVADSKSGFRYLLSEKGLLLIAVFFGLSYLSGGVSYVVGLPYFRETFKEVSVHFLWIRGTEGNGELVYMSVWAFMVIGRILAALFNYRVHIRPEWKYRICLFCFTTAALAEATYLFLPNLWLMRLFCLIIGLSIGISYNIRTATNQAYVPNDKKGRYNGAFFMLTTTGTLVGQLFGGTSDAILGTRITLLIFMGGLALSSLLIIGGGKKHVEPVFNRES